MCLCVCVCVCVCAEYKASNGAISLVPTCVHFCTAIHSSSLAMCMFLICLLLLVLHCSPTVRPIINSIYPSTPVQAASMSGTYLVPTGHTGIALTCGTFGWPPPHVEWIFNNGPLPNGVVYDLTNNVGIVSARLSWVRGFNSSDVGEYQCVVKESNTTSPIAFKNIQIIETGVTTIPPTSTCTVSDSLVHFQVRVLDTDCVQWGDSLKESIAGAFQDEIVRIIESQCSDCQVSQSTVQTLGLPACSSIKENGVVFRGTIETDKAAQTESIYCALSEWQQTAPLININANLFKVDSGCALRVDSFSSPECVPATGPLDMILIISIAVPVGAVLIIIVVIIILLCCVGCYCTRKRNGKWGPKGRDPYSRSVNGECGQSVTGSATEVGGALECSN